MIRDLVVVLPGILGSTLAKDGVAVWSPSAGAVVRAIATFGRSLGALTLPDRIGDEHPGDGVAPLGLMPDLHVVPKLWTAHVGYDVLLDRLRALGLVDPSIERVGNLLAVPYDWRLSNRYNGRRLKGIVEPALERWRGQGDEFTGARIVFVCHSMGGLVARWYVEREGGAEITRKLVTIGTPHRGALRALETIVNGVPTRIGPLSDRLSGFARSLPSLYQLLPRYACIETPGGLATTTEIHVPGLDSDMTADAAHFHDELDGTASAGSAAYDLHPIVGWRQPTATTARIAGGGVVALGTIEDSDEGGDGTVPRLAATPRALRPNDPSIRSTAQRHGALQHSPDVLDELEFVLGARSAPYRAGVTDLSVDVDEFVLTGEPIRLTAAAIGEEQAMLRAVARDESGREVASALVQPGEPTEIGPLSAGGYEIEVGGVGTGAVRISGMKFPILVWGD